MGICGGCAFGRNLRNNPADPARANSRPSVLTDVRIEFTKMGGVPARPPPAVMAGLVIIVEQIFL